MSDVEIYFNMRAREPFGTNTDGSLFGIPHDVTPIAFRHDKYVCEHKVTVCNECAGRWAIDHELVSLTIGDFTVDGPIITSITDIALVLGELHGNR